MARRACDVPGCGDRCNSARLCAEHTYQWNESMEARESIRTHEFIQTYQRWLKRVSNGRSPNTH